MLFYSPVVREQRHKSVCFIFAAAGFSILLKWSYFFGMVLINSDFTFVFGYALNTRIFLGPFYCSILALTSKYKKLMECTYTAFLTIV